MNNYIESKKLAVIFPGQGSQSVGMLSELARTYPIIQKTFLEASEVLHEDLWEIVSKGPAEKLNQTRYTQPAMLAAGVACWRMWRELNSIIPAYMAGHSLGEYTALVCAGVITFKDGVHLVSKRAEYMQEAVPQGQGAMAAIIGLDEKKIEALCQEAAHGATLAPANYNAHGQIVIAGDHAAVARAVDMSASLGAKIAKLLPVSVPAHCALMKPAAEHFSSLLADLTISSPQIPIINNVDVSIDKNPEEIRDALQRQLYKPVRWVEIITMMVGRGIEYMIECGPNRVLAGLNKRIVKDIKTFSIYDSATLQETLSSF